MNTTEVERKKEKKLDRSHWMCCIQKYTFNIDAPTYYMGYCPFFWMTWAALLVFPFVALIKALSIPLAWTYNFATEPVIEYRTQSREALEATPLRPSFSQMLDIQYMNNINAWDMWNPEDSRFYSHTDCKRIELWISQNPDWRKEWLPKAKAWHTSIIENEMIAKRAAAARRNRLRRVNVAVSLCGSLFFKVAIPTVIGLGIAGVVYLLGSLALTVAWHNYLAALSILAFCGASFILVRILCDAVVTISNIRRAKMEANENHGPSWISKIWFYTLDSISRIWEFVTDTITITYKQECPLIIWGEETGPIQKRNK